MRGILFRAFHIPDRLCFSDGVAAKHEHRVVQAGGREPGLPPPVSTDTVTPTRLRLLPNSWKAWAVSEVPTGRGTQPESALFDVFPRCWRSCWQTSQTDATRPDVFGERSGGRFFWRASAALGRPNRAEGNESRRVVSVWLVSCTFNIFWWCVLSLMCSGSRRLLGAAKSYLDFSSDAPESSEINESGLKIQNMEVKVEENWDPH